jgi:hypothetical protein
MKQFQWTSLLLLCLATALFSGAYWNSKTSGTTNTLYGVSYPSQLLCVVVGNNGCIYTSPYRPNYIGLDTWTCRTSGTTNTLRAIDYGGNRNIFTQYVAVGYNGEIITSPDGVTWTHRTSGTTKDLYSITYDHSGYGLSAKYQYVAVGDSGTILSSPDAITWTQRTSGTTYKLNGVVCRSDSFYVAVGDNGTIITSTNGITWTKRTSGTTSNLNSVTYGVIGRTYTAFGIIAVGDSGTILSSLDGNTWTKQTSGTTYRLNSIFFNQGYITVGEHAKGTPGLGTLYSLDGVTWSTPSDLIDTGHVIYRGVGGGNVTYVVVGDNGSILVAESPNTSVLTGTTHQKFCLIGKTVQIYTLQGKLIAQKNIESENYFGSRSSLYKNLSKGMYIVRIPAGNAVIARRVLVE